MREIKFRAWDLDNSEMYYQDREHESGDAPIVWSFGAAGIFFEELQLIDREMGGEHHQNEEYRQPNQILMQYTGLKDKNGKEIYEGDIIKYMTIPYNTDPPKKIVTPVMWNDTFANFGNEHDELFDWMRFEGGYEIIGNIHEHPELLEENK